MCEGLSLSRHRTRLPLLLQARRPWQLSPGTLLRPACSCSAPGPSKPASLASALPPVAHPSVPPQALPLIRVHAPQYDYSKVLADSYSFYSSQMIGNLPANFTPSWRSSALTYEADPYGSLAGGFVAGAGAGTVKLSLPIAYSTAILAWSAVQFPKVRCPGGGEIFFGECFYFKGLRGSAGQGGWLLGSRAWGGWSGPLLQAGWCSQTGLMVGRAMWLRGLCLRAAETSSRSARLCQRQPLTGLLPSMAPASPCRQWTDAAGGGQAYSKGNASQEMAATLKWGTDYLLKTMSVDTVGTAKRATKTQKFTHYFLVYQASSSSLPASPAKGWSVGCMPRVACG